MSDHLAIDFSLAAITLAWHNALLLIASVALVLIPGQALNVVLERSGGLTRIADFVESIAIEPATKALVIILGLAPAIESLTGFGVSLFVTVPILCHLFKPAISTKLSLLSMNIMPWGTLALATTVGAQLANQPAEELGWRTACFSVLAFPVIGISAATVLAKGDRQLLGKGLFLSFILGAALLVANTALPVDVAGIAAGLATTLVGYLAFRQPGARLRGMASLSPYVILLALLVFAKLAIGLAGDGMDRYALRSGNLSFAWYSSPGLPLLATAALLLLRLRFSAESAGAPSPIKLTDIISKVQRPLIGIFLFILVSQVLLTSGAIANLGKALAPIAGPYLAVVAPVLGALSGAITGSNLGGNVLMMPIQTALAAGTAYAPWVPAVQNAVSGHTLFASLPIIMLVLSVAGQSSAAQERELWRYSLRLMLVITALCAGLLAVVAGS